MNLDSVAGVIYAKHPRPAEIFAKAEWAGNLADICSLLAKQYQKEEKALIQTIQNHGLTSDVYEVQEIYRPYSTVNIPLLKQQNPETFKAAVHLRHADAVSILGKEMVYTLVADQIGDAISEYEVVTVTDVKKLLPASTVARYIIEGEEFVKFAVVRKDV